MCQKQRTEQISEHSTAAKATNINCAPAYSFFPEWYCDACYTALIVRQTTYYELKAKKKSWRNALSTALAVESVTHYANKIKLYGNNNNNLS